MPISLVLRADSDRAMGSGHVVRLLGLVDEVRSRGGTAVLLGEVDLPWVRELLREREVAVRRAPSTAEAVADAALHVGADAVVLDGYAFDPRLGATLRRRGLRVLGMRDGAFGAEQECDVAVDQNLGAERRALPHEGVLLAGSRYTLFRDEVLHAGTAAWPAATTGPRVLAFFGGSDPHHAAETMGPLVLESVPAVDLRVVSPHPAGRALLEGLRVPAGARLSVLAPRPDLLALARASDLVVSATGSSAWELLVHGLPFAAVQVADNQELGYRMLVERGLAAGLGHLRDLSPGGDGVGTAREVLHRVAPEPDERDALRGRALGLFDGRGRVRVLDALLQGPASPTDPQDLP